MRGCVRSQRALQAVLTAAVGCVTVIGIVPAAAIVSSVPAGASLATPALPLPHGSTALSKKTPAGELSIATPAGHKPLGIVPPFHLRAAPTSSAPTSSAPGPFATPTSYPCDATIFPSGCPGPLVYTTKNQAMVQTGGIIGKVSVYAVYWKPATYTSSFPSGYATRIDTYLTNIAATSRKPSNVFSVLQQYYTAIGGTKHHIHYTVTFAGKITMTTSFPTNGCTALTTYPVCLDTAQEATQLQAYLAAHATLPKGIGAIYLVYFPPKVRTCFTTGAYCSVVNTGQTTSTPSKTVYCAYHSGTYTTAASENILYGNMPFPPTSRCNAFNEAITGTFDATVMISMTSHELSETITDSSTQWRTSTINKAEIGDVCAYVYGTPLGGTEASGTAWNQTINGTHYFTQLEFSDENYSLTTDANGCIPREELPTASFTGSLSVTAGAPDTFTSTSADPDNSVTPLSYTWTWGDGTAKSTTSSLSHTFTTAGTYTVKLTVTDGDMWTNSVTHVVNVTATTTAAKLAITTEPASSTVAGHTFSVGVSIENASGSVLSTKTTTVALSISAGTTGAALTCTGTTTDHKAATAGVASFTCSIATPHSGYTLKATSGTLTAATTASFAITATTTPTPSPPPPPSPPSPPAPPSRASSHSTCAVISGACHASNGGVTVTASTGPGALTVSQYPADPAGTPSFSSTGEYFDVETSSTSTFGSVTVKVCTLNGGTKLYWWGTTSGKWETVSPVTGPSGTPPCLTATLSAKSTPTLSQLKGTVFAVGTAPVRATTRVYGPTPDATAAAELERAFPPTAGSCPASRAVVLATTATYDDALSSQFLAQSLTTGTLLTPTESLSAVTEAALKEEGISTVYVVGGPLAITTAVVSQIESLSAYGCGGKTPSGKVAVVRIFGQTQYATAAAVAEHVGTAASLSFQGAYQTTDPTGGTGRFNDTPGAGTAAPSGPERTAVLASGTEFQDAQAASVVSYRTKLPLLLTPATTLSATAVAAIEKLGIKQVILMGGTLAVTNTVEQALVAKTGVFVVRVAGKDATDTAVELARFEVAATSSGLGWTPGHRVLVARGNGFSDGIAGAVLDSPKNTATGPQGSARPLLLTETPSVVGTFLTAFLKTTGVKGIGGTSTKTLTALTALGGPLALSTAALAAMEADLGA